MAATAAVRHQPVVHAHDVQIGDVNIPIGKIQTSYIYRKDYSGKDIHVVKVYAKGGMGLEGELMFDFQLQTAEITNQFFQDLLAKAGASFSLYASSIKPDLVASGDGVKGVINIQFQEDHYCEEFDSAIAPVFFPAFQRQVLNGKTLKLTSAEGTETQITKIMNQSFAALNAQTHLQTADFLAANEDPRFYTERNQKPEACCPPHRDPHYFVALDGSVQKETPHHGTPPVGHFKKWDETHFIYYAPEPLRHPKVQATEKIPLLFHVEYATAISKISDILAQKLARQIECFSELAKKETLNAVDCEVIANAMDSGVRINDLTEEEATAVEKVTEEFAKRFKQLQGEV